VKIEVKTTVTTTITSTLAVSGGYPADFMTAMITISAALIAVAGVIIGVVATREDLQKSKLGKFVIHILSYSIGPGIIIMFCALNWFLTPSNDFRIWAVILLIFQFVLVYIPLFLFGRGVIFLKKDGDKPKQPTDTHG
jgi:hypothetical protein